MAAQESRSERQNPLSFMTTLSPWVRAYRPPKEAKPQDLQVATGAGSTTGVATTPDVGTTRLINGVAPDQTATVEETAEAANSFKAVGDAPALIMLFPWFSASPGAVAKYVNVYRSMYPSSEIVLVSTSMKQLLWRPGRRTPDVELVIPIIEAIASVTSEKSGTVPKPRILVHSFSNAGSAMLARVREAYGDHFPPHVTIFDSGPGLYSFHRCLNGATSGLPRWLWVATWPGSALIVISYATLYAGRRDAFRYWFEMHNEVSGEVRRSYVYSEADGMIAAAHVERHAHEAVQKGYDVRLEKFEGSGHVLHMREDEERYWSIVKDAWERPKAGSSKL